MKAHRFPSRVAIVPTPAGDTRFLQLALDRSCSKLSFGRDEFWTGGPRLPALAGLDAQTVCRPLVMLFLRRSRHGRAFGVLSYLVRASFLTAGWCHHCGDAPAFLTAKPILCRRCFLYRCALMLGLRSCFVVFRRGGWQPRHGYVAFFERRWGSTASKGSVLFVVERRVDDGWQRRVQGSVKGLRASSGRPWR